METFKLEDDTISDSLKNLTIEKDGNEDFESPFKWCIPDHEKPLSDVMIETVAKQDNYIIEDPNIFKWFTYTKLIFLIYEHAVREEQDQALLYMKMCEDTLLEPQNASDEFYKSIERALWHVFLATRLSLSKQENAHLDSVVTTITPLNEMNNVEQAGILGIKTMVLIRYFSLIDTNILLETIREAISLNPNEGEWHCREGIVLELKNMFENPLTADRNNADRSLGLAAFKKASELSPNNAFNFLMYAKELTTAGYKTELNEIEFSNHWEEVLRLYNKVLDLKPECPWTIEKACKILQRIPRQFRDFDKIMELLLHAEKRAPTFFQIHRHLGWIYKNVIRDRDKACEYFKRAIELGSHRAHYSYVMTKLGMDRDFNPIPILEEARDKIIDDWRRSECTVNIGCCYLFIYDDVDSALDQFAEAFEKYPQSKFIKEIKPVCLNIDRECSILELLHNVLNGKNRNATRRDEILKKVYEMDPGLEKEPPCSLYWKDAQFTHKTPRENCNYFGRHNDRRIQDARYQTRSTYSNRRQTDQRQRMDWNKHYERNSTDSSYTNGKSRRKNNENQGQTNDSTCGTSHNDYNSQFYPNFTKNENQRQISGDNHQRLRKHGANQSQWSNHGNQGPRDRYYSETQSQGKANRYQQLRNTSERNWRDSSPSPEGSWRR